jgi:hypothetical protein
MMAGVLRPKNSFAILNGRCLPIAANKKGRSKMEPQPQPMSDAEFKERLKQRLIEGGLMDEQGEWTPAGRAMLNKIEQQQKEWKS